MTRRRWLGVAALVVAFLLVGRFVAALVVDYRWYAALGPGPLAVWRARVTDLAALRLLLSAFGGGFVFANLAFVASSVESFVLPRRLGDLEIGETVSGRRLLWVAAFAALVLGASLSLLVDDWMTFDLVQFAPPVGIPEPYTGADAGFFVYWLPFETALYLWAIVTLLATCGAAVALYALTGALRWQGGRPSASRHVRRHVLLLLAALLLMLAWSHRLDGYGLLTDGSAAGNAFGYVDHTVGLRARFALATVTAVGALLMLNAAWQTNGRAAFWIVSAVVGATVLLRGLVPFVATRVIGRAAIVERDAPYLRNRAAMSQTAYGVNRLQIDSSYTIASVDSAAAAIPIWDPTPLARAVERVRRGEIVDDAIGWQPVAGRLGAVVLAHTSAATDPEPTSWTALVASATTVDARGDPLGVDAAAGSLTAERAPRRFVTFPQAVGYAVVSDSARRVAGDAIDGLGARLLHAWDERDFRLLFSDALDRLPAPVIVLRRDVRERLAAVAPFFAQGRVITPLLARDTVYWACHLYATSTHFPLSQRYQVVGGDVVGYYQHAAVALVNAETGGVTLLADDARDRLTDVWTSRFPPLFTPRDDIPAEALAALPAATDGVVTQAWTLARYGRRGLALPLEVRVPGGEGSVSALGVGHRAMMLLPSAARDGRNVSGWTLPLVDGNDNVVGLIAALGGATPSTRWLPTLAESASWSDANARLRTAVAEWTARAPSETAAERPELRTGALRVAPVAGRYAYVKPLYAVRAGNSPAAVGAVAVLDANFRVGSSVHDALGGDSVTTGRAASSAPSPPLGGRARALYDRMRDALRRGDWSAFGAAFDSLGAALPRTPPPR